MLWIILGAVLFTATLLGGRNVANGQTSLRQAISEKREATNRIRHRKCFRPYPYGYTISQYPTSRLRAGLKTWRTRWLKARTLPHICNNEPLVIRLVFRSAASAALDVAYCESKLWRWARNPSGATGLFQLMPIHWRGSFNPYHTLDNTMYAYRLSRRGTDWAHWVCKP